MFQVLGIALANYVGFWFQYWIDMIQYERRETPSRI